jgi:DNA-binding MarR family transcriptional regulator
LELYVEVLKTLGETQSLNFKAIQGKIQTDKANLSAAMKFLEEQNLVVLQKVSSSTVYKNTVRGIRVFKYLSEGTRISGQASSGVSFVRA